MGYPNVEVRAVDGNDTNVTVNIEVFADQPTDVVYDLEDLAAAVAAYLEGVNPTGVTVTAKKTNPPVSEDIYPPAP